MIYTEDACPAIDIIGFKEDIILKELSMKVL